MNNVSNPSKALTFKSISTVTKTVSDADSAFHDCDISANVPKNALVFLSGYNNGAAAASVGVREKGSSAVSIITNQAQWVNNQFIVQVDSNGIFQAYAGINENIYLILGYIS